MVHTGWIITQIHGFEERAGRRRVGSLNTRVAEIRELGRLSLPAEWTSNTHVASVQIRLRALALLVDHRAPREAIEPKRTCDNVRFVAGNQMRETPA
jgi:hypothetical protein